MTCCLIVNNITEVSGAETIRETLNGRTSACIMTRKKWRRRVQTARRMLGRLDRRRATGPSLRSAQC